MGHYAIATDEAGYGPKLGPLLVAATTWEVPGDTLPEAALARVTDGVTSPDGESFPITDSKELFQRGAAKALRRLEVPLCVALLECAKRDGRGVPTNLAQLVSELAPNDHASLASARWFKHLESETFPVDAEPWLTSENAADRSVSTAVDGLRRISARALSAKQFNTQCEGFGNKAHLLSSLSLQLIRDQMKRVAESSQGEPVHFYAYCDRHGGRRRYAGPLQQMFPEAFPWIRTETSTLSQYGLETEFGTLEIQFRVKGDRFGPVALASVAAKYMRERLMHCFNQFWMEHVGDSLRPTAGYGADAQRFCRDIAPTATRIGVAHHDYWRDR